MTKLRQACSSCPWRVDAPREYWDPSHFVSIWKTCQGDSTGTMGCHKSNHLPPDEQIPCQGWVRVMGYNAIGVRILAIRGAITDAEVNDKSGPALFKTFAAMLRANKIPKLALPVYKPERTR